jgi:hypothetical protein
MFPAAGGKAAQSQRDQHDGGTAENWGVSESANERVRIHISFCRWSVIRLTQNINPQTPL